MAAATSPPLLLLLVVNALLDMARNNVLCHLPRLQNAP
jgi:hypothetical protein